MYVVLLFHFHICPFWRYCSIILVVQNICICFDKFFVNIVLQKTEHFSEEFSAPNLLVIWIVKRSLIFEL